MSCPRADASKRLLRIFLEGQRFERVAALSPFFQATLKRPDAFDAFFSKEQRHTGAGGFVWSSTVEDDVAIGRKRIFLFLQLAGIHAESAGNGFRIGFEIERVAQIDDGQIFLLINLLF
jgi:hypothetical protein